MPELPEAAVVAAQLTARLIGGMWKDCWIGRPDIVREGLKTIDWYRGAVLTGVARHGKSVSLQWTKDRDTRYLVAELGMTGLLLFGQPASRYRKHTHVIISLSGAKEETLCYWNARRFGRIYLLTAAGLEAFVARRFGCDPLTVSFEAFERIVRGRRGRLKVMLMQQQLIAGIGNIYANEILFRAGLHPYRRASRLSRPAIRRLYDVMQKVLRAAVRHGGSSVRDFFAPDGTRGRYRRCHLVYDKAGAPCPSGCGSIIRRLTGERSSFYCPACQRR